MSVKDSNHHSSPGSAGPQLIDQTVQHKFRSGETSAIKTGFRTVPGFFCPFALPSTMPTPEPRVQQDLEMRKVQSEDSSGKDVTAIYNSHVDVSGIDEAKLVRKIDWRLLPWLSFLYLLSFLDRTSIGNARVRSPILSPQLGFDLYSQQLYNLTNDLRLSDKEYLLCLTIFYFSYSFFEVC